MARQPRKISAFRDPGERSHVCRRQRARSAHVDIEAGVGRSHLDVERFVRSRERLGDRPGCLDRSGERWREDGAAVDRHHVMGLERGKPNLDHVTRAHSRVKCRAAASLAMGVDQLVDRRVEARSRHRGDDQSAFPIAVARRRQMLERAAAANPKMWADRRDAVGAGDIDLDQLAAVGVAGPSFDFGGFTRQRIGHVDGARGRVGDAVAARAEPGNLELLHHGLSIANDRRCVQIGRQRTDEPPRASAAIGRDEELAIAVAAGDGRGDDLCDAPAVRAHEGGDLVADRRVNEWIAHDAFFPLTPANFELRLDQR